MTINFNNHFNDLFEAFDAVDANGILTFVADADEIDTDDVKGRYNIARELISSLFYDQPLVTVRLTRVKSFTKEVLVDLGQHSDGTWQVSVNFAKLMLLPGINPTAELDELRRLFEAFRAFMLRDPKHRAIIAVTNEYDSQGRIYGSARLTYQGKATELENQIRHEQEIIDQLISGSPAIQEYLRQVALSLSKLGRYSWSTITEDHLFGYSQGPWLSRQLLPNCQETIMELASL